MRRFRLALLMFALNGCSPQNGNGSTASVERETFSPSQPKPLRLEIVATPLQNGARIAGRTNLPDGTSLMLGLQRGPVGAGPEVTVRNGAFSADVFPRDGAAIPPGRYEVSVSSPLGDLQPDVVRDQLGSSYEALTGPLLRRDDIGRMIRYTGSVTIGGHTSAEADRDARREAAREYDRFTRESCQSQPDTVEQLAHRRLTPAERERSIQGCLREMELGRRDLEKQGLIEP
jgi:hypothetical protein